MAVRVLIDGLGDVAENVVWAQTELNTAAMGEARLSQMILRDFGASPYGFRTGKRVIVDLGTDETRIYGGYLWKVARRFWFPVDKPQTEHRQWRLQLVDNNILFGRRVVFKKSDPEVVAGPMYGQTATPCDQAAGIVYDDAAIAELVANWLDLSIDGIDVSTLVHQVASITYGQPTSPWNGGMTWGEAMTIIAQLPAAIFYLDPWWRLAYADVDEATAPYGLSDQPAVTGSTIPDPVFEDLFDRTVAEWTGFGGSWTVSEGGVSAVGGGFGYVKAHDWETFQNAEIVPSSNYEIQIDFRTEPAGTGQDWNQYLGFQFAGMQVNLWPYIFAVGDPYDMYLSLYGKGVGGYDWTTVSVEAGVWYTVKVRQDGTAISLKFWKVGDAEPEAWLLEWTCAQSDWAFLMEIDGGYADPTYVDNILFWDPIPALIPGEETKGYRECTIWENGAQLANSAFGWGFGKGVNHAVFKRQVDQTSIDLHGLWQDAFTLYNVWCQPTIDKAVSSLLLGSPSSHRGRKDDVLTAELVTYEPGFRPGQVVHFVNQEYGFDESLPIRESKITFATPDTPKYALKLGHVLDKWGFQDPSPRFPGGGGPGGPPNPCPVPPCEGPIPTIPGPDAPARERLYFSVVSGQSTEPGYFNFADDFRNRFDEFLFYTPTLVNFETFTRTGAWDYSDDGHLWTQYLSGYSFVNGTQGAMEVSPPGLFVRRAYYMRTDPNGPWSAIDWRLTWTWDSDWSTTDGLHRTYFFILGITDPGDGWTWWVMVEWNGLGDGQVCDSWGNCADVVITPEDNTGEVIFHNGGPGDRSSTVTVNDVTIIGGDPWPCGEPEPGDPPSAFDNFNRTEASGLGTSSAGYPWSEIAALNGATGSVNGTDAVLSIPAHTYGTTQKRIEYAASSGPWTASGWTMTARVKPMGGNGVPGLQTTEFYVDDGSDRQRFLIDSANNVVGLFNSSGGGNVFTSPGFDILPTAYYRVKWECGATSRVKFWADADAEPDDWLIERAPFVVLAVATFGILANTSSASASASATTADFDYIDFGTGAAPCAPMTGYFCETLTSIGDTMTLSRPYVPGSITATKSGVLIRPGTFAQVVAGEREYHEYDPAAGVIMFPSSAIWTLRVCYQSG